MTLSIQTNQLASDLRAVLSGKVITPDDAEYDEARTIFYGGFDRKPALIVQAANPQDVVAAINAACEHGLELAVRSGGHSVAGHGLSDGGLVLDLRNMRALEINVDERTAWVEPGMTAGAYTQAVGAHGLATGFGDTGSVGIGGITLGGGVGYLSRKYGLTIDSLLAAEIVTADGQRLLASPDSHPDLFWAIRGGGGNFGVVTRFKFQLHPVSSVVGGMLLLPATPEVITAFIAAADAAPEELSTIANIMPAPPMPFIPAEARGKMILMAMLAYAGDPEAGARAIAPIRALAQPIADMVRPMPYAGLYPPEDASYHPTAVSRTMFLDKVDRQDAETILQYLQASDAPLRVAQLRVLGGAVARVPADATAYAHRQSRIMANLATFYTGPEDRPRREAWVTEFAAALYQGNDGAYVNFMEDGSADRIKSVYPGATWDRLSAIKARYDPTNLFRLNQNIVPADSESGQ